MAHLAFVEARLDWLIEQSRMVHSPAHRRQNAIETMLATLTGSPRPIHPAREIRMSESTRRQLLLWVEAREPASGTCLSTLGCLSIRDRALREGAGWMDAHPLIRSVLR
jgi:hypothetical protein